MVLKPLPESWNWWIGPEKNLQMKYDFVVYYISYMKKWGKLAKIEMLSTFTKRSEIEYSTYKRTVYGELKGHFELHLEVIWRSQDENPPHRFTHMMILSDF